MSKFTKLLGLILMTVLVLTISGCSGNSENEDAGSGNSGSADNANEDFPKKEIELIVPTAAGGGTDAAARALAPLAEDHLGTSIGVVNKTGGSGSVGMTEGANSKPDGYTVTMVFVELTMFEHLGLSPLTPQDFKPIGLINFDPAALTVPADAPYDTLEEFISYAKEHPGEISVGNSGPGSIWHIAAANLEEAAGIELNHVPHDGAAPAVTALVGGHIDAVTVSPAEVKSQIDAGKLKMLAVMSDEKSDMAPDVPTVSEAGLDAAPIGTWRGLTVPKETPDDIVAKLEDGFLKAAEEEEFKDFMDKNGLGLKIQGSEEFGEYMQQNQELYGEIISDLDLD
ncbi:Protein BugT [Lentibacillus sp. JNUCC-1]|uniref:tripartite tricarboxylate transporter substrate binding protein n=1 Tax=Lentibacillus sp. JNUCC-1 TaxID=2654513 RepID=UPI0012E90642|nr:tripartite tricarboxylate transporter substrate binding protein [Lentibacillus sp. JNUCC-1]MUV37058.1 Protein BugT [Lentibacillus sp. JNUCC-1]